MLPTWPSLLYLRIKRQTQVCRAAWLMTQATVTYLRTYVCVCRRWFARVQQHRHRLVCSTSQRQSKRDRRERLVLVFRRELSRDVLPERRKV